MIIIEWVRSNWKSLGYPLAALFAFLWVNKTTPCPKPEITQTQQATQTAKASTIVKVVYRDRPLLAGESRPLPCPDIEVQSDASTDLAHWQSQQVATVPQKGPREALGLYVGAGYVNSPLGVVGLFYGPFRAGALGWVDGVGGLATYDFKF